MKIVFAGTPEFAARCLEALLESRHRVSGVLTQPDRPAGRGLEPAASPVKRLAISRGIEVDQPADLRDTQLHEKLRDRRPDIMVVVAYGLILPQAVLEIPRYGAVNIHASLLPRWREDVREIAGGGIVTASSFLVTMNTAASQYERDEQHWNAH